MYFHNTEIMLYSPIQVNDLLFNYRVKKKKSQPTTYNAAYYINTVERRH